MFIIVIILESFISNLLLVCVLSCVCVCEQGASVHVTVDWARRTDHMQHHPAQHLVSALFR
jgi:Ser-tRNA(Ala) deacylase AlaX